MAGKTSLCIGSVPTFSRSLGILPDTAGKPNRVAIRFSVGVFLESETDFSLDFDNLANEC